MIVEFTIHQPLLLETLRAVPSTRVIWEQSDTTANEECLVLFWAESDDCEAFEAALHDDPTVTAPNCLVEFSDRRLYQVEQVGEGKAQSVYPALVEVGGIIQQATATHEGWLLQVMFPETDALGHFYDVCVDHGLGFILHRKYTEADEQGPSNGYGLTEKQREMLVHAVENGYYEVPRGTALDELATTLNISHQAASERLRRAVDVLARHTVVTPDDRPTPNAR